MNPLAGAAGPGMYSTRTDNLNFQSTEYGSGIENAANLAGGPLAKTPDVRATSRSEMGMAPSQITPLYAPSERADEPVTAGIAMGDGPGPEALGVNTSASAESLSNILAQMLPYDTNGEIALLYEQAVSRGL